MSKQYEAQESELRMRQCVDDLATQWILGDCGDGAKAELASALAGLGKRSGEAGYCEAARVAQEIVLGLQEGGSEAAAAEIQEGLGRLQEALSEKQNAAPPEPAVEKKPAAYSLCNDPELVADFVLESREHLGTIEQRLLTLEREPGDADAVNSVFRGFHTIKGLAGFLEYEAIQEVAHEVETALNLAREGTLTITPAVIDVILESVDNLSRAIAGIEGGAPCVRSAGQDQLIAKVRALMAADSGTTVSEGTSAERQSPRMEANKDELPKSRVTEPPVIAAAPDEQTPNTPESAAPVGGSARLAKGSSESASVRVDTAKLDYLVDMVGEMVIAQSLVHHNQSMADVADPILHRDLAQLARITGEVQRTAMAMRMVPIGQLFQRTARQVRDLSRKVGKQVELVTRGEDTELDKTIGEKLADPLMHMVRNAIDHGIELPEPRQAQGKSAQATITLAAYHQGGQIVIEVADDGRGLDTQRILAKARQKGLVAEGARLSESDTFRLILEPGFSTADKVTDISGRGVGMDVVHKQVEKLRGRIEIRSQAGKGTTFLLKLPLTLAIINGLVVTIGNQRYIVPMFAVREMFRPGAASMFTVQNRQEMALVRGELLPMLRLYQRFRVIPRTEDPCEALLIVAESEGRRFCLMVDDLIGKQEVVIKSLGDGLGKVPGVAGGAILGDGRVGLILDMGGLWGARANS